MGNLSSVGLGVQQQNVQVLDVSDNVNSETRRNHVLGLLVRTVTNVWLWDGSSESSSDTRVNTLLLSPVLSHSVVSIRVVSLELLGVLLDDLRSHYHVSIRGLVDEYLKSFRLLCLVSMSAFNVVFDEERTGI